MVAQQSRESDAIQQFWGSCLISNSIQAYFRERIGFAYPPVKDILDNDMCLLQLEKIHLFSTAGWTWDIQPSERALSARTEKAASKSKDAAVFYFMISSFFFSASITFHA